MFSFFVLSVYLGYHWLLWSKQNGGCKLTWWVLFLYRLYSSQLLFINIFISVKISENNNILLCAGWSSEGAWDSLRIAVNEGPLFSLSTSTEALWKWCWVSRDTNLFLSLVLQSHAVQYLPQLRFIYLIYRQEGMAPWVWNLLIHMWKETYMHP